MISWFENFEGSSQKTDQDENEYSRKCFLILLILSFDARRAISRI